LSVAPRQAHFLLLLGLFDRLLVLVQLALELIHNVLKSSDILGIVRCCFELFVCLLRIGPKLLTFGFGNLVGVGQLIEFLLESTSQLGTDMRSLDA
jgi:hypothetical protein